MHTNCQSDTLNTA